MMLPIPPLKVSFLIFFHGNCKGSPPHLLPPFLGDTQWHPISSPLLFLPRRWFDEGVFFVSLLSGEDRSPILVPLFSACDGQAPMIDPLTPFGDATWQYSPHPLFPGPLRCSPLFRSVLVDPIPYGMIEQKTACCFTPIKAARFFFSSMVGTLDARACTVPPTPPTPKIGYFKCIPDRLCQLSPWTLFR